MALDILRKLILKEYPNYDFDRYHFDFGDIIECNDGSKVVCEYSTCEYIKAFVIRRGFKNRKIGYSNIYYEDLPYYSKKEGFTSLGANVSTFLKWTVGELRRVDGNMLVLLTEETGFQDFYALVLDSKNTYYLKTHIAIRNPYVDYIIQEVSSK